MPTTPPAIADFLAQKRIAVAGVSRHPEAGSPANAIYRKLKDAGYTVYAINPGADSVEGDPCWPDLAALPEPVDGVVAVTTPSVSADLARQCAERGIPRFWMHRSIGEGSVSAAATDIRGEHGIAVIDGACPMMFVAPVDIAHKCIRWMVKVTGGMPRG